MQEHLKSLPLVAMLCPCCKQPQHLKITTLKPSLHNCGHCKALFVARKLVNFQISLDAVPNDQPPNTVDAINLTVSE